MEKNQETGYQQVCHSRICSRERKSIWTMAGLEKCSRALGNSIMSILYDDSND